MSPALRISQQSCEGQPGEEEGRPACIRPPLSALPAPALPSAVARIDLRDPKPPFRDRVDAGEVMGGGMRGRAHAGATLV